MLLRLCPHPKHACLSAASVLPTLALMRIFGIFCVIFLWVCVDAAAQGNTNTNAVVVTANATNVVPVFTLSDETRAQLSFGLDKRPELQRKFLGIELWQY